MYQWGRMSKARLNSCDPRLIDLMDEVLKRSETDVSILCGRRGEAAQNKAYAEKKSKLKYPESKHNGNPSKAIDIAPYPIDWKDLDRFEDLAELVLDVADEKGINIRWGGDWSGDGDTSDETFVDMPHFELI